MLLFIAWKNKIARQKDKPVILLLDGHSFSFLAGGSLQSLKMENLFSGQGDLKMKRHSIFASTFQEKGVWRSWYRVRLACGRYRDRNPASPFFFSSFFIHFLLPSSRFPMVFASFTVEFERSFIFVFDNLTSF